HLWKWVYLMGERESWRIHLCQCSGVFHDDGRAERMERLRRYRVCISCTAILRVWPYPYRNRKSGDCAGGVDAGRKWRRYLLELVRIYKTGGMVCLFCKLVC